MRLEGKIAIVTGAGSGIGRETALWIAREGAAVLCADIKGYAEVADEIAAAGGRAAPFELDVRDAAGWRGAVAEAERLYGTVDCLANIAGIATPGIGSIADQSEEDWDRTIDINLKGSWRGMRAVLPGMIARGGGAIVNIASMTAILGIPGFGAYTASKGGIVTLTRQAAIEYVKERVRVNAIAPGLIETPLSRDMPAEEKERMAAATPAGRFGRTSGIASMIAHLFSDDGDFINGQLIAIDGGWSIA